MNKNVKLKKATWRKESNFQPDAYVRNAQRYIEDGKHALQLSAINSRHFLSAIGDMGKFARKKAIRTKPLRDIPGFIGTNRFDELKGQLGLGNGNGKPVDSAGAAPGAIYTVTWTTKPGSMLHISVQYAVRPVREARSQVVRSNSVAIEVLISNGSGEGPDDAATVTNAFQRWSQCRGKPFTEISHELDEFTTHKPAAKSMISEHPQSGFLRLCSNTTVKAADDSESLTTEVAVANVGGAAVGAVTRVPIGAVGSVRRGPDLEPPTQEREDRVQRDQTPVNNVSTKILRPVQNCQDNTLPPVGVSVKVENDEIEPFAISRDRYGCDDAPALDTITDGSCQPQKTKKYSALRYFPQIESAARTLEHDPCDERNPAGAKIWTEGNKITTEAMDTGNVADLPTRGHYGSKLAKDEGAKLDASHNPPADPEPMTNLPANHLLAGSTVKFPEQHCSAPNYLDRGSLR